MEKLDDSLRSLVGNFNQETQMRIKLSLEVAQRIETLMKARGLTKKQFADQLGRRPSEVTKWLSGEHNFTVASLARIGAFFGEPIIYVAK